MYTATMNMRLSDETREPGNKYAFGPKVTLVRAPEYTSNHCLPVKNVPWGERAVGMNIIEIVYR